MNRKTTNLTISLSRKAFAVLFCLLELLLAQRTVAAEIISGTWEMAAEETRFDGRRSVDQFGQVLKWQETYQLFANGNYEVVQMQGYEPENSQLVATFRSRSRGTWRQEEDRIILTSKEWSNKKNGPFQPDLTGEFSLKKMPAGILMTEQGRSLKGSNVQYGNDSLSIASVIEKRQGELPADASAPPSIEQELAAAQKQWEKEEQKREDEFKRIHQQKIEEWRTAIRSGKASFDDHPDVLMMKRLTGQEGTLIAPSVAKEYDGILRDRGWYPIPLSDSQKYSNILEGNGGKSDRARSESEGAHPDVPEKTPVPSYNSVREHFLKKGTAN